MLNVLALSCLASIAVATKNVENTTEGESGIESMNVIRFPSTSVDSNSTGGVGAGMSGNPRLTITIWLPSYFNLGDNEVKHPISSHHSAGNTTLERKPPKSIQLWLNRTSRTEVRLGPNIHRSAVEIYGKSRSIRNFRIFFPNYLNPLFLFSRCRGCKVDPKHTELSSALCLRSLL